MDPTEKTYEANKTDELWPPFTFMENGYFCWKGFILVYSLSRKWIFFIFFFKLELSLLKTTVQNLSRKSEFNSLMLFHASLSAVTAM